MTEVFLPVGTSPELGVLSEPLGEGESVTKAGEDREDHLPPRVSEHLGDVSSLAQAESVLVRAPPEDRGSEGLQGCSVLKYEVDVITWTWWSLVSLQYQLLSTRTYLTVNTEIY